MGCKISIIVPVHNEEEAIEPFIDNILTVLNKLTDNFEIIFINDGSSDQTLKKIITQRERLPQIKAIDLSRNFGKEAAITAGLDYASGEAVVPIDVDLQDPPTLLEGMVQKWQEGFDIVFAKRVKRNKDSFFKKKTATAFYWLWNKVADTQIPVNVGDYRLLDKKVVLVLRQIREKNRFMKGIFAWVGFKSSVIEFERPERFSSTTSFNFIKLYKLALDGILAFTSAPLKIWMYIGFIISISSFFTIIYLITRTVIHGVDVPGYASIMITVLFMGGINLFSLGIMGQYLARIYDEVKNRPIYLINKIYESPPKKEIK
ncbi:MAG: Glycosyltransferase involved in cell wall bisynthesis [Candidatus Midichloria mitochondrii]|uniref:Glycosyl transferase, family 2 n=1 Tax=Midichloria mitochondrii (strain IricVA) TaxID=696127 RepID=F7XTS5_MIDMI|nr:glycosyltransferase family 2 protein [Candidatus Midichloria mitochondrii]AEI89284.1 glycosyl transferase, family 2 [Candidatus Midichloria mitochondrii IricVA]MDJ1256419.1 glycosyltransferase family 2 protein [Candidatus Midichloria mitochondrii]MDJ1288137.1 glycosyltransferase family 2 protein [Candidatus Midichloria mitochondrii]MDJ1298980.1 glycosyltransferase family 2 protein [Candidatus Midichloria mitochondrii]MDJ1313191.1 glycosyltransferase family 2 protein [Candidatus Midichloria 